MDVTAEHRDYLQEHRFGVLSTGRKDGSPQASMVGCFFDGDDILVTFRRGSAKYHNISRQPRVASSVPDGRRSLTVYGTGELLEDDPGRVDVFQAILVSYGMPRSRRSKSSARAWTTNSEWCYGCTRHRWICTSERT